MCHEPVPTRSCRQWGPQEEASPSNSRVGMGTKQVAGDKTGWRDMVGSSGSALNSRGHRKWF